MTPFGDGEAPVDVQDKPDNPDVSVEAPESPDKQTETPEDSFTESYDPASVPAEVRPQLEAAYNLMRADYTRKRQADAESVREAQQAMTILEGLQDPERAPEILRILGIDVNPQGPQQDPFEDSYDYVDPNERIDQLQAQLAQRDEYAQMQAAEEAEDAYVAEQIESLEGQLNRQFSDEEIGLLYLYADQNRDVNGIPDVQAASALLDGVFATRQKEMLSPKANAPRTPGQGRAASRNIDTSTEEGMLKLAEQVAEEAMASSSE